VKGRIDIALELRHTAASDDFVPSQTIRGYPKTRLRLFNDPPLLGCRAGVRGFSDKL
jgi:hypothetical protein